MIDQRNKIVACLLGLFFSLLVHSQAREIGVLVIPGARPAVERSWQTTRWAAGPVLQPAGLAGAELIVATRTPDADDSQLHSQLEALRALVSPQGQPLSLAAGEILQRSASSVSLYLGYLVAQTSTDAELVALRTWARRHGYRVSSAGRGRNQWIVVAERSASAVLASVSDAGALASSLQPVVVVIPLGTPTQPPPPPGGFHRIPKDRNLLAATLAPNGVASEFVDAAVARGGIEISDWPDVGLTKSSDVVLVRFADGEQKMLDAQSEIRQLDLASVQELGPAVFAGKVRVLGNRLIVRYTSAAGRDFSEPFLAFYGLNPIHEIPWLKNTVVYQSQEEASYSVYSAADAVLKSGHATLALPDTYLWAEDADDTTLTDGHTDCIYETQPFLDEAQVSGAWSIWSEHDPSTRIAVIDQGFLATGDYCGEIRVKTLLDATDQELATYVRCDPAASSAWCDPTCKELFGSSSNGTHGEGVSMVAAAIHSPVESSETASDCEAPRGTIDGAETLLIRRAVNPSEWILSSLLVWAAGSEPGHARFGDSLPADVAASVLNLSFQLVYRDLSDCTSDTETDCRPVCTLGSDCTLLDPTLEWLESNHDPAECPEPPQHCIRDGGVLIVNARAHETDTNDLDFSPSTASIGTVDVGGGFVNDDGDYFHELSDYTEIVAPMGGDGYTKLGGPWGETGNSSAAAGAVSGIAAMMFDVHPTLTALQARCLLRDTAATRSDEGDWWPETRLQSWNVPRQGTYEDCELAYPMCDREHDCVDGQCSWEDDCTFQSGTSLCLGEGLVDAANAVEGALDCAPSLKDSWVGSDIYRSLFCACDAAGNPTLTLRVVSEAKNVSFSDSGISIPSFVWVFWECVRRGECDCPHGTPCARVSLENPHNIDWDDLHLEMFIENQSWPIPGDWPRWPAGGELQVSVPPIREALQVWRNTGIAPRMRVFSGGKEIRLSAPPVNDVP